MYKTVLIINIFNDVSKKTSTKFTGLTMEISLPFTPYAGLQLQLSRHRAMTIRGVSWDVSDSFFRVFIEDRFAELHGIDEISYQDWILHFTERGWTSNGEYPLPL